MVMPGLVNIHSHPASEPLNKGWNDEIGSPKLYNSSLYEIMPIFRPDAEGVKAAFRVALCEALMSGVTTLVDLSVAHDGWIDLMAESGIRGVLGPMYRDARWYTDNGYLVQYEWDAAAGRRAMETALGIVRRHERHPSGRLSGMVIPSQIDTCSAELLRDSHAEALRLKVPFQTHAAQSIVEFHEMTRRHGMTPIEWLDSLGVLGPTSIIGHGIFLDHHSATNWPKRDDLATIIERGVTVAHCPTVFIRRGITMQTVGGYIRRGVKIGIGTDTYPHNMIEEMRHALYASRIVAKNVFDLRTSDIFNAATLGGAAALQRDDIGRLAPGAKADLVMVDVDRPFDAPAARSDPEPDLRGGRPRGTPRVRRRRSRSSPTAASPPWTSSRRASRSRKRSGGRADGAAARLGASLACRAFAAGVPAGRIVHFPAKPARLDRVDAGSPHGPASWPGARATHVVALAQQNVTGVVRSSADAARVAAW